MSPCVIGIIGLGALILLLFAGIPVGFAMAVVGFCGFVKLVNLDAALSLLAKDVFSTFSSYGLTVIPLFIFMGQVSFHAGISRRLYDTAYAFIGHFRGGLAMATIGACTAFGAICGSSPATAATMATVALPEMKRYQYDMELATGAVASGGSLGMLIPPSVVFIVYGIMTEQSIGKLFMAGIIPGLIIAALFCVAIAISCRRNPELGPPGPPATLQEKIRSLKGTGETLLLFSLVMGGLFVGFFTPTEAGAVGALCSLLVAAMGGKLTWKKLLTSLFETTRTACMVMIIVTGAVVFGHFLAVTRIPYDLAGWVAGLPLPRFLIMMVIILVYLLGGCFIDALALILLTVPIFYPVILSLNYDPIWFGVIIVLVTQMGVISPPVGINVYVVKGVAPDIPLTTIFRGVLPFLVALVLGTILLIGLPPLSLFLPGLMR
ncbi:MAG: TRAP transporter large permease [Deltaproteobacteria bacterium]|nr:TRAP transporter large permease [Candidatus Anaeroferrophillus wilburensis]MBN2887884.1 TRAP transporter large permease [Deltaproteobacteria bacterium]